MDQGPLDLGLEGPHVLVTGTAGLIVRAVIDHFITACAKVSALGIVYPSKAQ